MRHINDRFIDDLRDGELACFLDQVKNNRNTLSLEIRNGYINIYYRGGNLLKITQKRNGYAFFFDAKYCRYKGGQNFALLNGLDCGDVTAYRKYFPVMMQEMDAWFLDHPKPERDYQHQLLVQNPEIVDIEYQIGRRMRLDMLLFKDGKLMIVENKYGTGAIGGKAGIAEHYADMAQVLGEPSLLDELISSVCCISQAKKALGLWDTEIERAEIKSVEVLFLLANYNTNSQSFSNEVDKIVGDVPAYVLMLPGNETKLDMSQVKSISAYGKG